MDGAVVGRHKAEIRLAPERIAHVEEEKLMEDMLSSAFKMEGELRGSDQVC